MKKLFLILVLFVASLFSFGQQTDKVDKVLTGVGNEVSALHTDTRDAISTLHQDATQVVETVYKDSRSVVEVLYQDVNKIVQYATPKIEAGLVALAQTLKTTVAEVFEALVMKQIAVSVGYALVGLLALLFGFFSYRIITMKDDKLLSRTPDYCGDYYWRPQWIAIFIATVVATIGLSITFMMNFQTMLIGFIAPKYGAIQEVVTIVDTLMK